MNIQQVIASIKRMHGDERDQQSKLRDYQAWLARQKKEASRDDDR